MRVNDKPRIAIVVQRYGAEVNGGAELHARLLAQALKPYYAVDVLTSRALDYRPWDRHYPEGEQWLDGCRVLRFDHPPRDRSRAKHMPLQHKLRFKLREWLPRLGLAPVAAPRGDDVADGLRYLRAQGPTMSGLMDYLGEHGGDYAALLFMTALYHPTALGVLLQPQRSILIPTLHDEKAMYLPHFHHVFAAPRWIMFNTQAEQELAHRLYGTPVAPGEVCGVGVPVRDDDAAVNAARASRWPALSRQLGVRAPFLLYLGRVDASKGCGELFAQFARFRQRSSQPLQLVVCGRLAMRAPQHADILLAGFVSDEVRDDLLAQAQALVVPSRYESLSLALLEGMAAGCAVMANRQSEVLAQHVRNSGVGWCYADAAEFDLALDEILRRSAATRAAQAVHARQYVQHHYAWPAIIGKFRRVIDGMAASAGLEQRR